MDAAIKRQLQRIAKNKDGDFLSHHEVTVIAHGLLNLCLQNILSTSHQEDLELFLRMLTVHKVPHHARSVMAEQCLYYLSKDEDLKKLNPVSNSQNQMTPETF